MTSITHEKQKIPKVSKIRQELPHKVESAEASGRMNIRWAIALVLLPFLIFWIWEVGARVVSPPAQPLPKPWVGYPSPYPPLTEHHWTGDLRRMARLPYYDRQVEASPFERRYAERLVDERGFVNLPGDDFDGPIDQHYDLILTGSSYMAEGSTMDKTLAAQLEQKLQRPVYNASWPGGSPTQGITRLLTDESFFQGDAKIIFFGMIQRLMYGWAFNDVLNILDEDGNVIKEYHFDQPDPTWKDYLSWRNTIENHLERTSAVREWSAWAGRFLPPMAFDNGYDAPVRIAWFKKTKQPILFFPGDIASTFHSYQDRGGDTIVEAIRRIHLHCQNNGIRLIVMMVPDKYEVYREHVEPKLYPSPHPDEANLPQHPEQRAPAVVVDQLHDIGIEAIDFYPALYDAQFNNGLDKLVYWVDDTHWSDTGVEIAAKTVVEYLTNNNNRE